MFLIIFKIIEFLCECNNHFMNNIHHYEKRSFLSKLFTILRLHKSIKVLENMSKTSILKYVAVTFTCI